MREGQTYDIERRPNPLPFYLRALRRRPGFRDGDQLPATRVHWPDCRFDQESVAAYAWACKTPLTRGQLPLLFPHSYFGPLHLLMLTDQNFPLKVLGALHLRNHIVQHQPLFPGESYDASLYFSGQRRRPQGLEVDFITSVTAGGQPRWESLTTYLFRRRFEEEDPESARATSAANLDAPREWATFEVPRNTGRTFGRITRDINPIHMSRWLARAFGFERDVCHGMWALSRGLSTIEGIDYWGGAVRNDTVFKGPLYIGRDITVKTALADGGHFELYSGDNPRPCLVSAIRNVDAGSAL